MRKLGVMLVAFDLPTSTKEQKSKSAAFRRNLIKNGYLMLQESVYIKLFRLCSGSSGEIRKLENLAPDDGNIMAFPLTLESFRSAVPIRGVLLDIEQFSDDLVVIDPKAS